MTQIVLQGLLNVLCIVYLDDVIIFSRSQAEHLLHLRLVLEKLTIHGLTCSIKKCLFAWKEVQYLEDFMTDNSNDTQGTYIKVIQEDQTPTN